MGSTCSPAGEEIARAGRDEEVERERAAGCSGQIWEVGLLGFAHIVGIRTMEGKATVETWSGQTGQGLLRRKRVTGKVKRIDHSNSQDAYILKA